MPRDLHGDPSGVDSMVNRNSEEIWIDGPLSVSTPQTEIWIDGPPEFCAPSPKLPRQKSTTKHRSSSHRQYSSKTKLDSNRSSLLPPKYPLSPFPSVNALHLHKDPSCTFDTESVVSSHCHVPVLPVFKDHSLLAFRPCPASSHDKPPVVPQSSKLDLRVSTNKLNDDMELLEQTLERLLIPSPIVPDDTDRLSIMTKSLERVDQLSLLMSNDEKSKRLSRIVSPTRFDRLIR